MSSTAAAPALPTADSPLSGAQRSHLRGLAHRLAPVVRVAQRGPGKATFAAIDVALATHELIKVRMDRPDDKHATAAALAAGTSSTLCGLLGHTAILYRARPENPEIVLPVPRPRRQAAAATPAAA